MATPSHTSPNSPSLVPISYHTATITDTPDIPVDLQGFERNIKKCKALLGMFTVLGLVAQGCAIQMKSKSEKDDVAWESVVLGFESSTLIVLLISLAIRPPVTPADAHSSQQWKETSMMLCSHRTACVVLTVLTFTSLSMSLLQFYRSNPIFYSFPPSPAQALALASVCFGTFSFVTSGLMRRGPKLYYKVPPMQLGSGLQATPEEDDEGLRRWLAGEEDDVEPEANVLDYEGCSLLSLLLGTYISPLWCKSCSKPQLNESDLLQLPYRNRAQAVALEDVQSGDIDVDSDAAVDGSDGLRHMTPDETFTPWGLLYRVWNKSLGLVIFGMLITSLGEISSFTPKLFDREIIRLFETGGVKTLEGRQWGYLMCLGATALRMFGFAISNYKDFLENYHLHGRVRIKLEQMLYAKLLRAYDPKYVVGDNVSGGSAESESKRKLQLVTLFGSDMNHLCSFAAYICFAVVHVLVGFGIPFAYLIYLLGWSALVSLVLLVALAPIVRYFSRSIFRMSKRIPVERDKRVSVVREMLQSLTAMKLNAWEESFLEKATDAREQELRAIRTSKLAGAVLSTFDRWIPMLAIWLAFVTHTVIRGKPFPASTALIAPKIFGGAFQALLTAPKVLSHGFSLRVSCERIASYLNSNELQNDRSIRNTTILREVTATWRGVRNTADTASSFQLDRVSIEFVPNSLNIVAGPLASGKTLLLTSILGETQILHGKIEAPRSRPDTVPALGYSKSGADPLTKASWLQPNIAYTPQVAYIEHGSVRSNIVFGQVFWKERYEEVIQACCLEEDIATWPDGDMTELGEGGHIISGGQQSRINLARSLYSRAETLLIDDPLSAVDNQTAKHLITHALCGQLVKSRTVILTTHHISLCVPFAKQIIFLDGGRIVRVLDPTQIDSAELHNFAPSSCITQPDFVDGPHNPSKEDGLQIPAPHRNVRQLIKAEERRMGLTARKHLVSLLKAAGGSRLWTVLLFVVVFNEWLGVCHTAWLARWSTHSEYTDTAYALGSLSLTIIRGLAMFSTSAITIFAFTWRASANVHQRLLSALLRAPMQTLQAMPTGRILNRFTRDMEQFDMELAGVTRNTLKMSFSVIVMLVSTSMEIPALLWVILALVPIFYSLQWRLAKFLSDAKKLNSVWTSPLLTMINDSQHAVTVIRAFGSVHASATRMRLLQTQKRIGGLTENAAWLLCRASLQGVGILIPTATGIAILQNTQQTAAWAGYTLSVIQFVTQAIFDLVMQVGKIDIALVTVERLEEYSQLPSEVEPEYPLKVPLPWLSAGHLQVQSLSAGYEPDLPDVLHDISFEVLPAERVGIVGRTGHGKSTLALCLLRALQYMRGKILIDSVDTSMLSLRDLRGGVSMIPQEAVLTSGTLRQALDINGEHSDAELHEVLKCVHLANDETSGLRSQRFFDLEQPVTSGGGNFSRGERQLLALARALLKGSKLLIMDEATSSVDQEMDEEIRQTIKHSFKGVTMLVIAHRLATVMDFDKVLVIKEGRVVEFDRPRTLLQNVDSEFYKLCATHGDEDLDKLRRLAGL